MSKLFIFVAVALLAFSIGIAYSFSGGSGGSGSSGGSGNSGSDSSKITAPPPPPEDTSSRMQKQKEEKDGTDARAREMMAARAKMMFKIGGRVLECGNQSTMRERVECRLKLQVKDSDGLRHVPEDCRVQNGTKQTDCLGLYDKAQPCRNLSTNDDKFACVREKINKTGNITSEYRGCQASQNPIACMAEAKEKVHYMAKFQIYNMENAAEKLLGRGVSNGTITDFITKLELHKVDFDAAATKGAKVQILKDTLADWQAFKKTAIEQIKAAKGGAS